MSSEQSPQRWTLHLDGYQWRVGNSFDHDAEHVEVMPVAEALELVLLVGDALGHAMTALDAHVQGHGPRGTELLPLLSMATEAADRRDALIAEALEART